MLAKALDLVQGSDEWLAVRRKYATASDMASIMGISGAFSNRDKVLKEKITGVSEEINAFKQSIFDQGHAAEESLREVAMGHLKQTLWPAVYLNEEMGILASIDCLNTDKQILVETKLSGSLKVLELAKKGVAWEPYHVQVQTQMLVLGYDKAYLFVLESGTAESFLIEIQKDEALQEKIKLAAQAFVEDVKYGKINEVSVEDERMKELFTLLKQAEEIETELSEPLFQLKQIEKKLEALKKTVAFSYEENTIVGNGVKITKTRPGTTLDRVKLEASGFDTTPFLKLQNPSVRVSLVEAV